MIDEEKTAGLKRWPGVGALFRALKWVRRWYRYGGRETESIFTEIMETNAWRSDRTVSGTGSEPEQTAALVREMPELFRRFAVRTVLDIPCGDFNWMRRVDLAGINYIGADIIPGLIRNNGLYAKEAVKFVRLDLLKDELPRCDLVIVRDCLVHFSFSDICTALRNIVHSGSKFVLTTTFPDHDNGPDIFTGEWRPVNLVALPFGLPAPLAVIDELCMEGGGRFSDKALALWRIEDIVLSPFLGPVRNGRNDKSVT